MSDQVLIDAGLEVLHHFGGGVYIKEVHIRAGLVLGQHAHDFDHLSTLGKGTAIVSVAGVPELITAPHSMLIEAGKVHQVQALSDLVWYCIWQEDVIGVVELAEAKRCGEDHAHQR